MEELVVSAPVLAYTRFRFGFEFVFVADQCSPRQKMVSSFTPLLMLHILLTVVSSITELETSSGVGSLVFPPIISLGASYHNVH